MAASAPREKPSASVRVQSKVRWSARATRALDSINRELNGESVTKRAVGTVVRQAIERALSDANLLQPALKNQLEKVPAHAWLVEVSFTDDTAIQQLNAQHRGKNKATDVLSFSIWEGEDIFPIFPGETAEERQINLGDIVISIETAARQARELNHGLRAEIAFLAVHGALHLLGYDHGSDAQRRKMFALQDEIVARVREDKGF